MPALQDVELPDDQVVSQGRWVTTEQWRVMRPRKIAWQICTGTLQNSRGRGHGEVGGGLRCPPPPPPPLFVLLCGTAANVSGVMAVVRTK